ncbi:MAG TPA: hypothetical protein VG294_17945 [Solirubrobacteraceae bacterium]|jgi:hypothetical protein|nr:hypothetical protein [Solirubrobacteraceae bacterium]
MRLLSDAPLVLGVLLFRLLDHRLVPAIPLAGLVAAQQHDSVPIGVEREKHSRAAVDPWFLQFVEVGPVDDVDVRPLERRTNGDNPADRALQFRPALWVQGS